MLINAKMGGRGDNSFAKIMGILRKKSRTKPMASVVFLKGVNVGGHRLFRPSVFAKELVKYDVVNVGAAGTFVVRKPSSQAKLRAELLRRLPFEAEAMICSARDIISLPSPKPFARSEEHTSELQSHSDLVCRLLLEKKNQ